MTKFKMMIAAMIAALALAFVPAPAAQADTLIDNQSATTDGSANGRLQVIFSVNFKHDPDSTVTSERFGRKAVIRVKAFKACDNTFDNFWYGRVNVSAFPVGEGDGQYSQFDIVGDCQTGRSEAFTLNPSGPGRIDFVRVISNEIRRSDGAFIGSGGKTVYNPYS